MPLIIVNMTPAQSLFLLVGFLVLLWELRAWGTTKNFIEHVERLSQGTSEVVAISALQGIYLQRILTTIRSGVIMGCTAIAIWVFGL